MLHLDRNGLYAPVPILLARACAYRDAPASEQSRLTPACAPSQNSYVNRVNANYVIVPPHGCLTFEVTTPGAYRQVHSLHCYQNSCGLLCDSIFTHIPSS